MDFTCGEYVRALRPCERDDMPSRSKLSARTTQYDANSVQTHYSSACFCSAIVWRHAVNHIQSHYSFVCLCSAFVSKNTEIQHKRTTRKIENLYRACATTCLRAQIASAKASRFVSNNSRLHLSEHLGLAA
ncbi:hypothetical protein CJI54_03495 [Bifidobacteriaceae bacterium NR026]|nr:hypothetical protein CJI54_03495 [Bifidobacteriaceae bacterium NR026]